MELWRTPEAAFGAEPATTGRMLVLTDITESRSGGATPSSLKKATESLSNAIGLSLVHSSDLADDDDPGDFLSSAVKSDQGMMFDDLGVAVVEAQEDYAPRLAAASADSGSAVQLSEPERVVWVFNDYLTGYQEGVNALADSLRDNTSGAAQFAPASMPTGTFTDDATFTWGLKAVGAPGSTDHGSGTRVAVLDTGADMSHPDLVHAVSSGRARSFISGETVDDAHGHGTHCCGTVAGRLNPTSVPRYGVAPDTDLFVGKVLSNRGSGSDAGIIGGIQWAIRNRCHVISMSLGAGVRPGTPHSAIFERIARRALARGSVIIAAAGNSSNRPGTVNPVGHPANCPSILAVAALDQSLAPARFSDAGRQGVDHIAIGGPGVSVLSAAPGGGHTRMSGTSMATPHVSGVAAAIAGREGIDGPELAMRVLAEAQGLAAPSVDVGAGLATV